MTLMFVCRCGASYPRLVDFLAHREAAHGDRLLGPSRAAEQRHYLATRRREHYWRTLTAMTPAERRAWRQREADRLRRLREERRSA